MQLENDDALRRAFHDLASEAPAYQDRVEASATLLASRRGGRSWLLAVAAVFAVIALIPIGVYLATAADDSDSPQVGESAGVGTSESTPTPRPDLAAADEVRAVGQRLQKAVGDEPGFGEVRLDFRARTVTLYWDGEPPSAVETVRDVAAEAGITVVVVSAQFSIDELVAAGYRILNDDRSVTQVRPNEDLSGLLVGYLPEDLPSSPEEIDGLVEHFEEISGGIPVELEEGSPVVNLEEQ